METRKEKQRGWKLVNQNKTENMITYLRRLGHCLNILNLVFFCASRSLDWSVVIMCNFLHTGSVQQSCWTECVECTWLNIVNAMSKLINWDLNTVSLWLVHAFKRDAIIVMYCKQVPKYYYFLIFEWFITVLVLDMRVSLNYMCTRITKLYLFEKMTNIYILFLV